MQISSHELSVISAAWTLVDPRILGLEFVDINRFRVHYSRWNATNPLVRDAMDPGEKCEQSTTQDIEKLGIGK